jgi:PAS domain S-box-containing protein
LRIRATLIALCLSTLPVLVLGGVTYQLAHRILIQQAEQSNQSSNQNAAEITYLTVLLERQIRMALIAGTGISAALAGAIAVILANRSLRPILSASQQAAATLKLVKREAGSTAEELPQDGQLDQLESDLHWINAHLPDLLHRRRVEAELTQLLTEITLRIRKCDDTDQILDITVREAARAICVDRVVVYRFNTDGSGTIIAEHSRDGLPRMRDVRIMDPCFRERHLDRYSNGAVTSIDDVYQAKITDCYREMLERFSVKANLVTPICRDGTLIGLLIAHQCLAPKAWQPSEISFFAQVATQVGYALDRVSWREKIAQSQQELNDELRPRSRAIAGTSLGIAIADATKADYPLVYCNPAFERITGYSNAEVVGRNCRFLQGADTDPDSLAAIRLALREQRDCHVVLKNYRKDGTPFWNELAISPVRDDENKVTHFVAWQTDVSDRQQLLHQVQVATQKLTQSAQEAETAIKSISAEVSATDLAQTLSAMRAMASSVQEVAGGIQQVQGQMQQMQQAIATSQGAQQTAEQRFASVLDSLPTTANQVQHFSQMSDQVLGVVETVHAAIASTTMLAMNAVVESGQTEGDRQALLHVAEAVRSLSEQSTLAGEEIEHLVQQMTQAGQTVVTQMRRDEEELLSGTQLLTHSRQDLDRTAELAAQVTAQVQTTTTLTTQHSHTLLDTHDTLTQVEKMLDRTNEQSAIAAVSLNYLLKIASQLRSAAPGERV